MSHNLEKEKVKIILTVRITRRDLDNLEKLVKDGVYYNKNEAIRAALRLLYEKHSDDLTQ